AQFVAATPAAARLYGYSDAAHLCGVWHSFTQRLEDYHHGVALSIARHFKYDVPTRYLTDIQTLQGAITTVSKSTRELSLHGDYYWLTEIQEAAHHPDLPHARNIPAPTLDQETRLQFGGILTLADMEAVVASRPHAFDSLSLSSQITITSPIISQKPINTNKKALVPPAPSPSHDVPALTPGATVEIKSGWYLHWCQHCLEPFRSKDADPPLCGRRKCRKKGWRTGADSQASPRG
ncbi:MAG: hypothetical protein OEU26_33100, partial [Candidatus Tectomicrobia bacterium]|nr:hypothetical protein [Candidatus Tectomicrobia bacterium]